MGRGIPTINYVEKICVICEGYEEVKYLEKLRDLNLWNKKYKFVFINAKSNGNLFPRYQNEYQNNSYNLVLIFCDTDKRPYKQFDELVKKINNFHDSIFASNNVIIFGNPCTMQIILSHYDEIKLITQAKGVNCKYIEKYTGIKNYEAKEEQINQLMTFISRNNYREMLMRVESLSRDYKITPSTNFSNYMNNFEDDNDEWIKEINKKL